MKMGFRRSRPHLKVLCQFDLAVVVGVQLSQDTKGKIKETFYCSIRTE